MQLTLSLIQTWLPGSRLVGDGNTPIHRIHTDSRTIRANDLFIAIRGESFDAHDFLKQVAESPKVSAIGLHGVEELGLNGIVVNDTRLALGLIARRWREQFTLPAIAVTGSNGKTTVTQMVASILRAWKPGRSWAPVGSFNNDIGVPLTLLGLNSSHEAAVFELGMNHPGEIAYLAPLVQPTVALVNNAQREHLEFMHSVDAVAAENATVFNALPDTGTAIYPHGDLYASLWRDVASNGHPERKTMTFGDGGQVSAKAVWHAGAWTVSCESPLGSLNFRLRIAGKHNVSNSLAAIACAIAVGVPKDAIVHGLEAFEAVKGRSRAHVAHRNSRAITLIDDSYNANPDSVRAAIEVLAALPAPRVLVLGDMGEVGEEGPEFHREAGEMAKRLRIEHVLCLGALSKHTACAAENAVHFDHIETLQRALDSLMETAASVLIKGSRFMRMERVVEGALRLNGPETRSLKEAVHAA